MILWIKAFHIMSAISWMVGLLYLPRLFVYHVEFGKGSPASETFKIMERRLLKIIMNPAMIFTWISGLYIAYSFQYFHHGWLHAKIFLVLLMSAFHGYLARHTKSFARDGFRHKARFYRFINEIPTILMIGIIILVVVQPF